ncbi:MAG TPA: hypothetical protein VIJ31_10530 [Acidothermaceae bacterium]
MAGTAVWATDGSGATAGIADCVLGCAVTALNAAASAGVTALSVLVTAQPAMKAHVMNLRVPRITVGGVVPTWLKHSSPWVRETAIS